ncbi:hypothetical protein GCM10011390_08910 [Aureimonas endophytica]|uniref:Nucleotidyltransferase family protein n=1 Tax=Aureimonas endophytica TaxID=2027858 RepID=A0A916ZFP1_9HYPH|nr:nucleotidyltransferase family protein [Aureimonas endophytica]GGD92431.1 hypothetical protein GCM10011390_08910 [Aureimonas endophytica]
MTGDESERFMRIVCADPINAALLERLAALRIENGFLVAGCLFQTYWNHLAGRPGSQGIKDYDIFYFDGRDLSYEAEDAVLTRIRAATADLGIAIDVKNQARVHLWYERRFGHAYPPLQSCEDGIERYLVACTCLGIAVEDRRLYAPNGFGELSAGLLRRNPNNSCDRARFLEKAESYRARWPWLRIMDEPLA